MLTGVHCNITYRVKIHIKINQFTMKVCQRLHAKVAGSGDTHKREWCDVWYTIVPIDFLQVIHMTIIFQDNSALNLVSTIFTLVIFLVLEYLMSSILSYLLIICESFIWKFIFLQREYIFFPWSLAKTTYNLDHPWCLFLHWWLLSRFTL